MKKSIQLFLLAIDNELYFDEMLNKSLLIKDKYGIELIKPTKFEKYLSELWINRFIIRILYYHWLFIGFVLIFYKFFKSILKLKNKNYRNLSENLCLGFSSKVFKLINQVNIEHYDVIEMNKSKYHNNNAILILDLNSFKDVFKVFKCSLRTHLHMCFNKKYFGYRKLNSLYSFDWFLVYNTLSKFNNKNVYFSNHFDRWAIMFDNINFSKRTILQHGVINHATVPPIKLGNIDEFYCFNDVQFDLFVKNVFKSTPLKYYLKFDLKLKDVLGKNSVLIISCLPITYKRDVEILKYFLDGNFNIFLKPHPVYSIEPYEKIQKTFRFDLIRDKDFFPNVDYVISYDSTLGFEYEVIGKTVIYINDDKNIDIRLKILNESLNEI